MRNNNFISLPNILGSSEATQTTVNLFNSLRIPKKDNKGLYLLTAIAPYKNGVITEKQYI